MKKRIWLSGVMAALGAAMLVAAAFAGPASAADLIGTPEVQYCRVASTSNLALTEDIGELRTEVVRLMEAAIGKKAKRELLPMQPGDVPATYADVDELMCDAGFRPSTPLSEGIARFVAWYRAYHRL